MTRLLLSLCSLALLACPAVACPVSPLVGGFYTPTIGYQTSAVLGVQAVPVLGYAAPVTTTVGAVVVRQRVFVPPTGVVAFLGTPRALVIRGRAPVVRQRLVIRRR